MTVLALPNQPAALLAITSGRAVADLTDHSTAVYNAKTIGNGNTLQVVVDPAAPKGYQPTLVGIGMVAIRHRACHHRAEGAAGPDQRR